MADILDQEREKDTRHNDSRRGSFVLQLAQAVVGEHQVGVRVELRRQFNPVLFYAKGEWILHGQKQSR